MVDIFENMPVTKDRSNNESGFYKLLRKHLPRDAHAQRIETGGTGLGIPDLNVCYKGKEAWIELKTTAGNKPKISANQVAWHLKRNRAGGNTFFFVRKKASGPRIGKVDNLYVISGKESIVFGSGGIDSLKNNLLWDKPLKDMVLEDWKSLWQLVFWH